MVEEIKEGKLEQEKRDAVAAEHSREHDGPDDKFGRDLWALELGLRASGLTVAAVVASMAKAVHGVTVKL